MVGAILKPETTAELAAVVRDCASIDIVGSDSKRRFRLPVSAERTLSLRGLNGVIEWSREDQVVTAFAGTSLDELQAVLSDSGQCVPTPSTGTLGGAISMNLPFPSKGSWKDWILGATVVLVDGTIAKSGSRVVKSVAGYDAHKLAIGSRGSFFILASVTLRTFAGVAPDRLEGAVLRSDPTSINPIQARLMARAKGIFDATSKLNPGEWGDF